MESAPKARTWEDDAEDLRLLKALQAGPDDDPAAYQAAWDTFVRRHQAKALRTATHLVGAEAADEVVQETFIAFYRALRRGASFDRNVTGWLARVATRRALNALRNAKRRLPTVEDPTLAGAPENSSAPAERTGFADEARRLLADLTQALPERVRLPVVMYYCAGLTQPEIAQELDCTQQSVSKRLKQGLESLKNSLKRHGYVSLPAMLPLDAALREALTTGSVAPPLQALHLIPSRIGEAASRATARIAAANSISPLLWIAAGLAFAAAAAGAYVSLTPNTGNEAQTAPQSEQPAPAAPTETKASKAYPRNLLTWDFTKEIPEGLRVQRVLDYHKEKGLLKTQDLPVRVEDGMLQLKDAEPVLLVCPVDLDHMAVRVRFTLIQTQNMEVGILRKSAAGLSFEKGIKYMAPAFGIKHRNISFNKKFTAENFTWWDTDRRRMVLSIAGDTEALVAVTDAFFASTDSTVLVLLGKDYAIEKVVCDEVDPAEARAFEERLKSHEDWHMKRRTVDSD
ncbi:MAG: sigma-70 family RNA polymerase sigma factor [Planctomycetes bacterium]|nr:sigma-70 family RNA polymerase sigma factor [Planctomycetota bacterium]